VYRTRLIAGVLTWILVVAGGGALLLRHDVQVRWVPELRFGGVDLTYALRRVAAEADILLTLDEINVESGLGDLSFRFFGGKIAAGPLTRVLDAMQAQTSDWSYEIDDGVLYVRSEMPSDVVTHVDDGFLKGGTIHASLPELMRWIMQQQPSSLVQALPVLGQPYDRKVTLDIPDGASPMDVFRMYAKEARVGWRMARAGYLTKDEGVKKTYVASGVRLWSRLDRPANLPSVRLERSPIRALVSIDMRVDEPLCIFDQSVLGMNRGLLDFDSAIDPGLPIDESMNSLGFRKNGRHRWFVWKREGGRVMVRSRTFLGNPYNSVLLDQKVHGAHFEGTLADLAGLLNASRIETSPDALLGGEVIDGLPRAELDIPEGSTIADALYSFAEATGVGFNYVLLDLTGRVRDRELPEHTWRGAWVSSNVEWNSDRFRHD
jgi:hypothetical protein